MPILGEETAEYPSNLLSQIVNDEESDRVWWAVYTKARQEKAFARQLESMDVPFYLPLVAKDNLIRGKKVKSRIPLFSGYVFLFGNKEERTQSLTTNRVSSILPVEDQCQLTTDLRQISKLIGVQAPMTLEQKLDAGDPVRIKTGPMKGLEGVVVTRRAETRLLVSVKMLQQGVSVEIDDFVLEPLR